MLCKAPVRFEIRFTALRTLSLGFCRVTFVGVEFPKSCLLRWNHIRELPKTRRLVIPAYTLAFGRYSLLLIVLVIVLLLVLLLLSFALFLLLSQLLQVL